MKTLTKATVVAVLFSSVLMANSVWAQEQQPATKTPEQVVSEFWDGITATVTRQDLLESLTWWVVFPRLAPQQSAIEGATATVVAVPQERLVEVKLALEDGQWKVDLLATLADLPEPFRPDLEQMRAEHPGVTVEGELPPGTDQPPLPPLQPPAVTPEPSLVVELSLDNSKPEVLDAEVPVLVCFWTEQSDDALLLKLIVEDLAHDYIGKVKFAAVDTAQNVPLTIAFGVTEIPCLVLFRGEEEMARRTGVLPRDQLKQWLDQQLAQ